MIATTHPAGPQFEADEVRWRAGIDAFSRGSRFVALEIVADEPGDTESFVTFRAGLRQSGADASFTERSRFLRLGSRWFYHSGVRKG